MEDEDEFPVNFRVIKDYFRERFMKYLAKFEQGFLLMVDPEIYKIFSYVLFPLDKDLRSKIKKHYVLDDKIDDILTEQFLPTQSRADLDKIPASNVETIVFILKPNKPIVQKAYMVRKILERSGIIDCNYMFIPRGMKYLSESYLISNPEKVEFINMNIVPLERDVLSLELYDSFFNCLQLEDLEFQTQSYEAILRLEKTYGTIKYKFACGVSAVNVLNKLLSVSTDLISPFQASDFPNYDGYASEVKGGEIDALILIDRKTDLVTPFCTQQTYEGMLDEHFGIAATNLEARKAIIRGEDEEEKKAVMAGEKPKVDTMSLRSDQDLIIDDIRDLHFVALESKFSQRVIDIDRIIKEKDNPKNVEDLQKYIEKLKNMKITQVKDKLTHHINLAHYINSEITNFDFTGCLSLEQNIIYGESTAEMIQSLQLLMAKGVERDNALRLFALMSITQSGLKEKVYQELYKQYIDCYGFEEMVTLLNMEETGIYKKKQGRYDWSRVTKDFQVINEEVQLKNPVDYSYVYNGYSPVSVKIVDYCMSYNGFGAIEGKLKPACTKYKYPSNENELFEKRSSYTAGGKKVILVFYVGGVTYSEISAIRFLNKMYPDKVFVIATTQIINYKKCIDQMRKYI